MIQLVYRKSLYKGIGTKEELDECPYCGKGDCWSKLAHANFISDSYGRKVRSGTKDGTNVYICSRCDELYPTLTFIRRCDMNKASLKPGQAVLVDGNPGFTVEKLMNLSAKVVDEKGKSKIVPYSSISVEGKSKAKKKTAPKTEDKPAEKKTKQKKSPANKSKDSYTRPDDEQDEDEDSVANDVTPTPVKQYKRKVGDDISNLLDEAGTPTKMADAVKKHEAYAHINKESFKKTVAQKNDLQSGLFKMRLANLLRAAVRRMEKA